MHLTSLGCLTRFSFTRSIRWFSTAPSKLEQAHKQLFDISAKAKIGDVSGYRAYTEAESTQFNHIKQKIARVYQAYGFSAVENRPIERAGNLALKGGIGKEIYTLSRLEDGQQIDAALPFDRTVPLALWIAEHINEVVLPYKRFDIAYSFRGEHAVENAGRFRGFIQSDVDIINKDMNDNMHADAETLATTIKALESVDNIPTFTVHMNHIRIAKAIIPAAGIDEDKTQKVLHLIDKLDKMEKLEITKEIKSLCPEVTSSKIEKLVDEFDFRGNLDEFQVKADWGRDALAGYEELKSVVGMLGKLGVEKQRVVINTRIVRGLDYYTGIVCETFFNDPRFAKYGSIASGGRYDNLVDTFVGKKTGLQGVGFSIGLTRLYDILLKEKCVQPTKKGDADVLLAFRTREQLEKAVEIAFKLRSKGLKVDLYSGSKKIADQLKYADRRKIPFSLMVMDEKNSFVVKNLQDDPTKHANQIDYANEEEAMQTLLKRHYESAFTEIR